MGAEECFAYRKGKCRVLDTCNCKGCNFYKTKEQLKQERLNAIEYILSLDKLTRDYIKDKYYGGSDLYGIELK